MAINSNLSEIKREAPKQWGDFDGTEEPFGSLPAEWAETAGANGQQTHWSREWKLYSKMISPTMPYEDFMSSIINGLDKKEQETIYEQTKKIKNINPTDDVDSVTATSVFKVIYSPNHNTP